MITDKKEKNEFLMLGLFSINHCHKTHNNGTGFSEKCNPQLQILNA